MLLRTGRTTRYGPMNECDYLRVIGILRRHGVRLKVNTVVTRSNLEDDLTGFIIRARPERWKLLQVLPVQGQNDALVDQYTVASDEFESYVQSSRWVETFGIKIVPENNELMTGSYVMVDPAGRFFDNVSGTHSYSRSHCGSWGRKGVSGRVGGPGQIPGQGTACMIGSLVKCDCRVWWTN